MYRKIDQFTTRDGRWEADSREYGIDQGHVDRYGEWASELGCATCLFVRIEGGPAREARFFTRDGLHSFDVPVKQGGWANYPIEHGSGYNPDKGEIGWWCATVANYPSEIVENLGLPRSWHVSTFVVFRWEEEGSSPTPVEPTPGPAPEPVPEPPSQEVISVAITIGDKTYTGLVTQVGG